MCSKHMYSVGMDYDSAGGKLRIKRTQTPKESLQVAAERLAVNKDTLSLIERGKRLPSLTLAAAIERVYGIPAASWVEAP